MISKPVIRKPLAAPDYASLIKNLDRAWKRVKRPRLTLAEKILHSHAATAFNSAPQRGESYLKLRPDRVAMQDASAQTALLQFMLAGKKSTAVPSSIHCDHLIEAFQGGNSDLLRAEKNNNEIFGFLRSAAMRYGIDFWKPGSGIIHQIVLEQYATPGSLLLGTDSHTPNAGGLGMIAIGVGGADAVDAMANLPWELKAPKSLGVRLTGRLNDWASPKDVILRLAGELTVQGATNHIIEYFGPGTESLSCTGMATICNMGAEVGATTSLFPFTHNMHSYLAATGRAHIADAASAASAHGFLRPDEGAEYDKVIEINLSQVEPHLNGPFTPDRSTPVSKMNDAVLKNDWPTTVSSALIGSCTNSSYEDMTRAASIAEQALSAGLKPKCDLFITPGSEQIRATMERDGLIDVFERAGGKVLANACGPCIGQWKRTNISPETKNAIVTSFNRNFRQRNDGYSNTMNFLASPEIVMALAFSGQLGFNPMTHSITDGAGNKFMFKPPAGIQLPQKGFETESMDALVESSEPSEDVSVNIDPSSQRLQVIAPFPHWDGKEVQHAELLVKVSGKCTTDHISAAGPWLKYKGHLENISKNTLIGATNAFSGKVNAVKDAFGKEVTIPDKAFELKSSGTSWAVVGDWNYGEGSAREHAAMQPRFLGCKMIVCRSFARIHETNLKKQGILPLTFQNPSDYDLIPEDCHLSTRGLTGIAPGSPITLIVTSSLLDKPLEIPLNHTMSNDQIEWFKAGSALNMIASQ